MSFREGNTSALRYVRCEWLKIWDKNGEPASLASMTDVFSHVYVCAHRHMWKHTETHKDWRGRIDRDGNSKLASVMCKKRASILTRRPACLALLELGYIACCTLPSVENSSPKFENDSKYRCSRHCLCSSQHCDCFLCIFLPCFHFVLPLELCTCESS